MFLRLVFHTYPKRAILGATLMITQSFLYNAIFFTYALVLIKFYGVQRDQGAALRPGVLDRQPGRAADPGPAVRHRRAQEDDLRHLHRSPACCSALSAWLFDADDLNATTQTFVWVVIFFFASAGASAAYLTVSETWPIEIRAEAIAVFFAIGAIFGALGPAFYGALIGDGSSRTGLFIGYLVGAGIMIIGGVVEVLIGINAEGKSLEAVTKPLTAVPRPRGGDQSEGPGVQPAAGQARNP